MIAALLKLILLNPRVVLFGGAAVLAAGSLAIAGETAVLVVTKHDLAAARADLKPEIERRATAEAKLDQLSADSDRRAADAARALDAATKLAAMKNGEAKVILSTQPSNPNDLCGSAHTLISQTLASEKK